MKMRGRRREAGRRRSLPDCRTDGERESKREREEWVVGAEKRARNGRRLNNGDATGERDVADGVGVGRRK